MGDITYLALKALFRPFRYELVNPEDFPADVGKRPYVFVSNHLGVDGAIALFSTIPARYSTWVISDTLDKDMAYKPIYHDFVEPNLGISGKSGELLAKLISKISVPLINSIDTIPVYRNNGSIFETFKLTKEALNSNESVLILADDPEGKTDEETGIKRFLGGFAMLGDFYYRKNGERLPFLPIAVERTSKKMRIGQPLYYQNGNSGNGKSKREAAAELADTIETKVKEMYLGLRDGRGE